MGGGCIGEVDLVLGSVTNQSGVGRGFAGHTGKASIVVLVGGLDILGRLLEFLLGGFGGSGWAGVFGTLAGRFLGRGDSNQMGSLNQELCLVVGGVNEKAVGGDRKHVCNLLCLLIRALDKGSMVLRGWKGSHHGCAAMDGDSLLVGTARQCVLLWGTRDLQLVHQSKGGSGLPYIDVCCVEPYILATYILATHYFSFT
jgi:hypothetical protein